MMRKQLQPLTEEQLQHLADHLNDLSEDGWDFPVTDTILDQEYLIELSDGLSLENLDDSDDSVWNDVKADKSFENKTKKKMDVIWKLKNLILNDVQLPFKGYASLPSFVFMITTPYECFKYFLFSFM